MELSPSTHKLEHSYDHQLETWQCLHSLSYKHNAMEFLHTNPPLQDCSSTPRQETWQCPVSHSRKHNAVEFYPPTHKLDHNDGQQWEIWQCLRSLPHKHSVMEYVSKRNWWCAKTLEWGHLRFNKFYVTCSGRFLLPGNQRVNFYILDIKGLILTSWESKGLILTSWKSKG